MRLEIQLKDSIKKQRFFFEIGDDILVRFRVKHSINNPYHISSPQKIKIKKDTGTDIIYQSLLFRSPKLLSQTTVNFMRI